MNSDQNSIKNQGGGEPKPYKPEEGSTGNINPQKDLGNQGQKSQSPNMPPQPEPSNNNGDNGAMNQGGNMNQPNAGGNNMTNQSNDSNKGPANIPSPPGLDSDDDFQKNFSQNSPGNNETPTPGPTPGDGNDSNNNIEQPSQDGPGSVPPQDFNEADLSGDEYPPKKSNKKLFVILLIIILALGAAVAVYFLFLSPSSQEPVVNGDNEPEAVEEENNVNEEENQGNEVPTVPVAEEEEEGNVNEEQNMEEEATTTEEGDVTEEENNENQQSSNIPADSHESLFSAPADTTESITIESLTMESLYSELSESPTEVPLFKEVVFQDSDNNLITFGDVVGLLAPSVFSDGLLSSFEQDATFYTYTDANGTWFGVVASLNNEADSTSVQNQVSSIENNTNEVSNFFLNDTGQESSWNDGGAGDVTSRYMTFGSGNASFNYGWSGNNLVIGTSYSAFQEVVERL